METSRDGLARVILESARDQRTLDFLIATCGQQAVERACSELPGGRRAYVSNLARILKVSVPDSVIETPRADGAENIAAIKKLLERAVKRMP
ncbi:hypothetical protein GGD41_005998 [Paraburkholderia bryophila]|uniref:Uncharacterized protein n=1 Tax=Paraburkholderia bryophila TaxID=420952 RepID=A0A7Z0B3M2_9BURK|nr:hypothetical protein [Paraburkholderia bryophila]